MVSQQPAGGAQLVKQPGRSTHTQRDVQKRSLSLNSVHSAISGSAEVTLNTPNAAAVVSSRYCSQKPQQGIKSVSKTEPYKAKTLQEFISIIPASRCNRSHVLVFRFGYKTSSVPKVQMQFSKAQHVVHDYKNYMKNETKRNRKAT